MWRVTCFYDWTFQTYRLTENVSYRTIIDFFLDQKHSDKRIPKLSLEKKHWWVYQSAINNQVRLIFSAIRALFSNMQHPLCGSRLTKMHLYITNLCKQPTIYCRTFVLHQKVSYIINGGQNTTSSILFLLICSIHNHIHII